MKVLSYKSWKIVNIERIEQETLWMSIVIDIIQVIKVIENWENWSLWKLSRLKTSKTIMTIKTKKIIRVIRVISSQSSESLESSQSSTNSRGSFIPSYVFIKIWEQDKNIYKLSGSHIKSLQLKRFYGLPQRYEIDCNKINQTPCFIIHTFSCRFSNITTIVCLPVMMSSTLL